MNLELSRQILKKYSTTKFHEILFSGNRAVPNGHIDGQKDAMELTGAFRHFANMTKILL